MGDSTNRNEPPKDTDWKLCILCQTIKENETLTCPQNNKANASAYVTISTNICAFEEIGFIAN